jgi:GT2 family glycosyltransferase
MTAVAAPRERLADVGVVVVGRNEGARLERCLASVLACTDRVLYVDSGSADGSATLARTLGVAVWELDPAQPFSAARARNEGFERLLAATPELALVQFVDGDCEMDCNWLARGRDELLRAPQVAMVSGRVREIDPEASCYNRLCALEWDHPAGDVRACGGNFMIRVSVFRSVRGFRPEVVAAEDDELCLRVRQAGGCIRLLDGDMVRHDAALLHFGQWWRRAQRCGHAYALGFALHGRTPERHFRREMRSLILWGALLPLLALIPAAWTRGWSLLLLAGFPMLALRIYNFGRRRGWPGRDARLYAVFTVLGKLPGVIGMIRFYLDRWRGRHPALIEHKETGALS